MLRSIPCLHAPWWRSAAHDCRLQKPCTRWLQHRSRHWAQSRFLWTETELTGSWGAWCAAVRSGLYCTGTSSGSVQSCPLTLMVTLGWACMPTWAPLKVKLASEGGLVVGFCCTSASTLWSVVAQEDCTRRQQVSCPPACQAG